MSADEPKAAPSLAERMAELLRVSDEDVVLYLERDEAMEALAALDAVEAVRALHNRKRTMTMGGWWFSCEICGSQWPCATAKAVHDKHAK